MLNKLRNLRHHWIPILLAFIGLFGLYFAGLGTNPLMDPDEPIYGQFVKEMVRGGDWLTPHYNGQLWFDKPPMYYWLSGISVKLFGLNEFALRFPSALFAIGIVLMVYLLAAYDFGKRAGIFASLVMATCLMQLIMSHAAATDAVMVFFIMVSLYAYRRWLDETSGVRLRWMALCGVSAGLGMVTKGPVVPVLLCAAFILHLLWIGEIKKLRALDILTGCATAVLFGFPWFVAMYMIHGKAFVDGFIITNNLARFSQPLHKSQSGKWYYCFRHLALLFALFVPWSVFLPQAIARNWRAGKGAKLLMVWLGVVVVFFSLSKTQNFTYTYPAFPTAAIFVGALLSAAWRKPERDRRLWSGAWAGLAVSILLASALLYYISSKFPGAMLPAIVMAASLVGSSIITIVGALSGKSKIADTVWITSGAMLIFILALLYGAMPVVSYWKSSESLSTKISRLPDTQVVAYKLWRPGLFYYLNTAPENIENESEIHSLIKGKTPLIIVCSEKNESHVARHGAVELFGYGDLDVYANPAYVRQRGVALNKSEMYYRMDAAD